MDLGKSPGELQGVLGDRRFQVALIGASLVVSHVVGVTVTAANRIAHGQPPCPTAIEVSLVNNVRDDVAAADRYATNAVYVTCMAGAAIESKF